MRISDWSSDVCSSDLTLTLEVGGAQTAIIESAEAAQINLRILGRGRLGVSLDETCDERTVEQLLAIFLGADHGLDIATLDASEIGRASCRERGCQSV